jgi:hypothetical protein
LDQIGLLNNILDGAYRIEEGRKGFAVPGQERQGRLSYKKGLALTMATFQEAQRSADPQTIIRVEMAFLNQELEFCAEGDTDTRSSLTHALQRFWDALRALETVEDAAGYKFAETTYSTDPKKRVHGHLRWPGFRKDVFHQACGSHSTRLRNILRSPGIEMLEKALLKQRATSMKAAQDAYVEKQRKVLLIDER